MHLFEHKIYAGKVNRVVTLIKDNNVYVGLISTDGDDYQIEEYEGVNFSFIDIIKGMTLEDKYWILVHKWGEKCDYLNHEKILSWTVEVEGEISSHVWAQTEEEAINEAIPLYDVDISNKKTVARINVSENAREMIENHNRVVKTIAERK